MKYFYILLLTLLLPIQIQAIELYSLVMNGCETKVGLIVNTDENEVHILDVDGGLSILNRKDIELILVYNIHDNPIQSIDLNSGLKESLKEVYVDDIENTNFIGWPIRFVENLIVFYDINGKTHLVDLDKIKIFKEATADNLWVKNIANYKNVSFGLGDNLPECKDDTDHSLQQVEPTRMISDRIRVHKFFTVYSTGFTNLKRFQRKTQFYAKPFLYDKETRLGFLFWPSYRFINRYKNEIKLEFVPIYLQWSSGSHYGSQGEYSIGSKPVDLLPTVEPQFSLQSDVKSHFLTGTFVGNPVALSGGKDFLIPYGLLFERFFDSVDKSENSIYNQFNYLVLTGVEYDKYSLSAGFYYPVFGIFAKDIFREITSTKSSPMIRLMRTTKDLSFRLIYSRTNLKSSSPSEDGIGLVLSENMPGIFSDNWLLEYLDFYDLKTQYMRVNLNYDLSSDINIGFSEVVFQGEYKENLFTEDYKLNFLHFTSSLSVKQSFGDYTAIKAEINHFLRNNEYKAGGESGESSNNRVSLFFSIEFFL